MSARGRSTAAVLLGVVGGLTIAGGAAAPWVRIEEQRDIGGVPVPDVDTIGGLELAPALLPLGLVAVLAGLALLLARGRWQQALAVLLALGGLGASALLVAGLLAAPAEGGFGAGVGFTGLGALALVAAGVLALRPGQAATLPPRYDLGPDEADDEWRLASDDDGG